MTTAQHIAVLDDEVDITVLLAGYLHGQGYRVSQVHSGPALMSLMAADRPDLVLLDLGLPGEDGLSLARQLRERWDCGLVIVTGRGDAVDKVVGLEIGADDYVTKPFDLRELLARCRAVLRRNGPSASPAAVPALAPSVPENAEQFTFEGWTVDTRARRVSGPRGEAALTAGEYDLLVAFVRNPGRVLTRDYLLDYTRGRESGPFDRTIDVQVARLRKKLEADPEQPKLIKSVRGAGYLFVPAVKSG